MSPSDRVRLLLSKGHSCYRPRRKGERKRKSVRGCIVDATLSVVSLVLMKKGEQVRCSHVFPVSENGQLGWVCNQHPVSLLSLTNTEGNGISWLVPMRPADQSSSLHLVLSYS